MKGSQKVIDAMNAGLTIELTAINQYFIQGKMCKNWGLERLAAHHVGESIEEMKHAEMLIDRILFLDGVPEIARYDVIRVGNDVLEQLQNDLKLEMGASKTYNAAIHLCGEEKDSVSKQVMELILKESEDSIDWLETQLDLISKIGIQNYLQSQIGEGKAD
jgi:bacterioferritin